MTDGPREDTAGGIVRFVPIAIPQSVQPAQEIGTLRQGHLQAHQHPPIGGAMIAVMEQADVPAPTQAGEEVEQGTGSLGKLKAH